MGIVVRSLEGWYWRRKAQKALDQELHAERENERRAEEKKRSAQVAYAQSKAELAEEQDEASRSRGFASSAHEHSVLEEAYREDRDRELEKEFCPLHFPPAHERNPAFRYWKSDCPVCFPEETAQDSPELSNEVTELVMTMFMGGESLDTIATYFAQATGSDKDRTIAALAELKATLAARAVKNDQEDR